MGLDVCRPLGSGNYASKSRNEGWRVVMHEERERSEQDASPEPDREGDDTSEHNSEVDEQSEESFPASDPPSY